ncbi:MAG: hypothetical protein HC915_20345 [Anaerolineae bacterium]|nr:hypothetical protein [Anaerolineae bacterium]
MAEFTRDATQVWYITTPETAADDPLFFDMMEDRGYLATPYPIQNPRYRLAAFSVWRFQRAPEASELLLTFGEERISLVNWFSQGEPAPCASIRLQSWWRSEAVPLHNYSLTVILTTQDGTPVLNLDGAIGETLMQLWEPERLYFDDRHLTLPCDLTAGTYDIRLGLYWQSEQGFEQVSAQAPDGQPLGERVVLLSFEISR